MQKPPSRLHQRRVRHYYHSLESVVGYRLMVKGVKHFGYHDNPAKPSSVAEAQLRQDDLVAEKLGLKPGLKVLECGCGEGGAANYLASKYGSDITGIDLLPRNIARAKRQAVTGPGKGTTTFQVADYMDIPFADNTFDAVYAMETLVHAPDPIELFKGLLRVLKPGGKLLFCEYSMTPRDKLDTRANTVMTKMNTYGYMPSLEHFTKGAFPKLLTTAGFVHISSVDITPHFLPTLAYFYERARRPNKVIKAIHLEKHFINAYSAAEIYQAHLNGQQLVQYNFVTAQKPTIKR